MDSIYSWHWHLVVLLLLLLPLLGLLLLLVRKYRLLPPLLPLLLLEVHADTAAMPNCLSSASCPSVDFTSNGGSLDMLAAAIETEAMPTLAAAAGLAAVDS